MLKLEDDAPAPDILFHFGLRVREKYGDDPRLGTDGPAVMEPGDRKNRPVDDYV